MILITGTTGLVGTHLLAYLILQEEDKNQIIGLYRSEEKKEHCLKVITEVYGTEIAYQAKEIDWKLGDICDLPFLESIFSNLNYVYHCAGLISNAPSKEKELRKVNIEGTANLVNLSIDFKIKKFCYLSSIASLGEAVNNQLINEENYKEEHGKASLYSISKYGGEMEVWRGTQEGLNAVILNPGVIIGEGFYASGSGEIISKANKNFPIYIDKITGFVDVKDVVFAMHRALNAKLNNKRYILVSENKSMKEVQFELAELLDKKKPFISLKTWMLIVLIIIESVLSFFKVSKRKLSYSVVHDALKVKKYNATKSITELEVIYTPISKSLKRVAKHYLSASC